MMVIDRETETALDAARDRYAAAVALARRNEAALTAYATYLAPHGARLLDAARSVVDKLPPARHASAWRDLLDSLAASHVEIVRVLDRPATTGSATERAQHTALWPHPAFWMDCGSIAADLADQRHQPAPELTAEERQMWTEMAHAARRRGELERFESWYAADGRLISLAYLVEGDASTVIALAGDPDAAGWEVIGHYDNEYAAGQALPRPVPSGVPGCLVSVQPSGARARAAPAGAAPRGDRGPCRR